MYTFSMYVLACSPMFRLGSCITDHDREVFFERDWLHCGRGRYSLQRWRAVGDVKEGVQFLVLLVSLLEPKEFKVPSS